MKARSVALLAISLSAALLAAPRVEAHRGPPDYSPSAQPHGPTKKGEQPPGGRDGRPPHRDERHQGRLSDEDRRGLHQDLDRASREIYKPGPRR